MTAGSGAQLAMLFPKQAIRSNDPISLDDKRIVCAPLTIRVYDAGRVRRLMSLTSCAGFCVSSFCLIGTPEYDEANKHSLYI